jgi:hypothetical protein
MLTQCSFPVFGAWPNTTVVAIDAIDVGVQRQRFGDNKLLGTNIYRVNDISGCKPVFQVHPGYGVALSSLEEFGIGVSDQPKTFLVMNGSRTAAQAQLHNLWLPHLFVHKDALDVLMGPTYRPFSVIAHDTYSKLEIIYEHAKKYHAKVISEFKRRICERCVEWITECSVTIGVSTFHLTCFLDLYQHEKGPFGGSFHWKSKTDNVRLKEKPNIEFNAELLPKIVLLQWMSWTSRLFLANFLVRYKIPGKAADSSLELASKDLATQEGFYLLNRGGHWVVLQVKKVNEEYQYLYYDPDWGKPLELHQYVELFPFLEHTSKVVTHCQILIAQKTNTVICGRLVACAVFLAHDSNILFSDQERFKNLMQDAGIHTLEDVEKNMIELFTDRVPVPQ